MTKLRITFRAIVIVVLIVAYILVSLFWRIWTRDLSRRRYFYVRTVSFFCRLALKVLNVKVNVINNPGKYSPFLIVSNHLGLLDIFVLSSIHPSLFITSVEMREAPGLGFLTEMGGCLYVERRSRANINEEIEKNREALNQQFSVALYPEGTSTNGEQVLPFKKSLLVAAAGTGIPILPSVINYRKVNGEPMSHRWRDYVCWYGDQTFPPYAMRLLSVRSVEVDIEFFNEVPVHSEEQRREVAASVQTLIESKYTKIPMPQMT